MITEKCDATNPLRQVQLQRMRQRLRRLFGYDLQHQVGEAACAVNR
jgi:hypothetical protein